MKKTLHHLGAALTLSIGLTGLAQTVPQLINYQGQLLGADGTPMPTGDYTVEVRLFPVASGGGAIWGPQVFSGQGGIGYGPKVPVVNGRFNLVLGPQDINTNDLPSVFAVNPVTFIELKVGTGSPISPRQQILASPYALKAGDAGQFGGFGWDSVFTDTGRPDTGHIPGFKIAPSGIGTQQVTNGAITPAKLNLQSGNVAIGQASASYPLDVLTTNNSGPAIRAVNFAGGTFHSQVFLAESGDAIYANGTVIVQGNLVKTTGSFRIDHPLDPANKYLYHSFVESPDMKNIYDGLAVLDSKGEAQVELPAWFEALNKDFRYQLTAIGAPAPNLHIAEVVTHNKFKIAGGADGTRVSWQVTGIRQDAYANAHRIQVEVDKPAELRGFYLHPEELGQPKEMSVESMLHPVIKPLQK